MCRGGTLGELGGERTHTLTVDELAEHSHIIDVGRAQANWSKPEMTLNTNIDRNNTLVAGDIYTCCPSGKSQPHNNMPPYVTVSIWKRIE